MREQWLQERMEYFSELEQAIFDEALGEDECTRPHVQAALQRLNPDLPEAKASFQGMRRGQQLALRLPEAEGPIFDWVLGEDRCMQPGVPAALDMLSPGLPEATVRLSATDPEHSCSNIHLKRPCV